MSVMSITGRLGSNAELRETTSNKKVVQFSVANKIGFGDKATTQWVKCTWWGDRAAKLCEHMTKGSIIEVSGSPSAEAWLKKADGSPQAAIVINVQDVTLHGGGQSRDDQRGDKRGDAPKHGGFGAAENNDDIPW